MPRFKIRDVVVAVLDSHIWQNAHDDLRNYHSGKARFLCERFELPDLSDIMRVRGNRELQQKSGLSFISNAMLSHLIRSYCVIPDSYWGGIMCYTPQHDGEMDVHNKYSKEFARLSSELRKTIVDALTEVVVCMFPHTKDMEFEFDYALAPDPIDYW